MERSGLVGGLEGLHLDFQQDRAHLDELLDDVHEEAGFCDQAGGFNQFVNYVPFGGLLLIHVGGPVVHRRPVGIDAARFVFREVHRLFQGVEGGRGRQRGALREDALDAEAARVAEGRVRLALRVHGHGDVVIIAAAIEVAIFLGAPNECRFAHILISFG